VETECQQSGHVVIGFEADLDWANMKGSGTFVPSIGGVETPRLASVAELMSMQKAQ
jgi:hypothetical protein